MNFNKATEFPLLHFFFSIRQLGTHYPDNALALVSAAGWIKKEDYGDSNLFFRHDISTSHTSPSVKSILEACTAENDADKHVTNLHVSFQFSASLIWGLTLLLS